MNNEETNATISTNSSIDDNLIDMLDYYGYLPSNLEQAMIENGVSWHGFI